MATKTMRRAGRPRQPRKIPVRKISDEDLQHRRSARAWTISSTLRGDIVLRRPDLHLDRHCRGGDDHQRAADALLLPGRRRRRPARPGRRGRLLRARAAARERARTSTGSTSSTCASARRSTTWASSPGLLLVIFARWLLAAGALYALLFGWATPTSIREFLAMVFTTPRGWALIVARRGRRRDLRLVRAGAQRRLAADAGRSRRQRRRSGLRLLARGACQQGEMLRWGLIVTGAAGARLDPAVRRPGVRAAVARLFDLAPLHAPDRPRGDPQAATLRLVALLPSTLSSRKRTIVVQHVRLRPLAGDRMRRAGIEHHLERHVRLLQLGVQLGAVLEDDIVVRHAVDEQQRIGDLRPHRRAHPTSDMASASIAGLPRYARCRRCRTAPTWSPARRRCPRRKGPAAFSSSFSVM